VVSSDLGRYGAIPGRSHYTIKPHHQPSKVFWVHMYTHACLQHQVPLTNEPLATPNERRSPLQGYDITAPLSAVP